MLALGSLIGCLLIFRFGKHISSRVGLWIASACTMVSLAIQIGSTHIAALYVGRIILGFSNGFYLSYSVIYMGEAAPAFLRGPIIGMVIFHTSFGGLLAILTDNYSKEYLGRQSYQIPLAVMFAIPVVISVGLFFLPESPRYYVTKGREADAAAAIRKLRGLTDEHQINEDVAALKRAWEAENELRSEVSILDVFRGTDLRRTLISVAMGLGQTASGMGFLSGFSVYFFTMARIGQPFVWVMVNLAIALTGNILAFPAARFIRRRWLLTGCSLINAGFLTAMAIVYTVNPVNSANNGKALVGLTICFVWVYGFGQGPTMWALEAEIPSQRLRSQTVGLATVAKFVSAWLSSYCSPYFINPQSLNWGPKYCYIWGGANLLLAGFAFCFVPETKGRSLEQLDELFEKRISTFKFSSYVTDLQQLDTENHLFGNEGGVKKAGMATEIEHVGGPGKASL